MSKHFVIGKGELEDGEEELQKFFVSLAQNTKGFRDQCMSQVMMTTLNTPNLVKKYHWPVWALNEVDSTKLIGSFWVHIIDEVQRGGNQYNALRTWSWSGEPELDPNPFQEFLYPVNATKGGVKTPKGGGYHLVHVWCDYWLYRVGGCSITILVKNFTVKGLFKYFDMSLEKAKLELIAVCNQLDEAGKYQMIVTAIFSVASANAHKPNSKRP